MRNNKILCKRSLVYRRALSLIQLLVIQGRESISLDELKIYIKGHLGASPKTVRSYLDLCVQFELIKSDRRRVNFFKVNPEKCFFPPDETRFQSQSIEAQNELLSAKKKLKSAIEGSIKPLQSSESQESKTLVYLEDRGRKGTCSFKGYLGTWGRFRDRCKELGLDICYVQDAFENAFLVATDEARMLVETPIRIGLTTLIVNLILPYVVKRPRRRRMSVTFEEDVEV